MNDSEIVQAYWNGSEETDDRRELTGVEIDRLRAVVAAAQKEAAEVNAGGHMDRLLRLEKERDDLNGLFYKYDRIVNRAPLPIDPGVALEIRLKALVDLVKELLKEQKLSPNESAELARFWRRQSDVLDAHVRRVEEMAEVTRDASLFLSRSSNDNLRTLTGRVVALRDTWATTKLSDADTALGYLSEELDKLAEAAQQFERGTVLPSRNEAAHAFGRASILLYVARQEYERGGPREDILRKFEKATREIDVVGGLLQGVLAEPSESNRWFLALQKIAANAGDTTLDLLREAAKGNGHPDSLTLTQSYALIALSCLETAMAAVGQTKA